MGDEILHWVIYLAPINLPVRVYHYFPRPDIFNAIFDALYHCIIEQGPLHHRVGMSATDRADAGNVTQCWRMYKKHKRKEGAKQECLVGR